MIRHYVTLIASLFFYLLSQAAIANYDPVTEDLISINQTHPPSFHEVFIPIDNIKLTGFILTANGQGPHPTVVMLHGLPGNEKNLDLAQSLRRAGFNILFFHYRGSWGSEGNYSFTSLHTDVLAAINFLRINAQQYRVDIKKLSILGHSFGGYAALRAGAADKALSCVVALSAANPAMIANSDHVNNDFNKSIGAYIDTLFMLKNFTGKQSIKELFTHTKEMDTRTYGKKLRGKNILLVVGSEDTVTPPILQKDVVEEYSKVKGLELDSYIIPGDHAYSISRIRMQKLVVNWSQENCK